jgi:hypothetical protein
VEEISNFFTGGFYREFLAQPFPKVDFGSTFLKG